MQKSPGSRALWRSGLFSLCAGALISLVLLRFLSQLDQPGLTPEDLRRSGAALALQILSISAAAIGFVTYTSLRTRSSLEQALTTLTESCRIFRSAARAAGAMVFCRKAPGRELISPQSREEIAASVCSFMNGSAMVLISISGTNIEMFFACTLPMRPAPIMPTFIYFLSSFIQ